MEAVYDHKENTECKQIGLFAKENNWRLVDNRPVGGNILYELFYQKGVLTRGTKEPYQIFNKYFKIQYHTSVNGIENRIALLKPEGQEYFKKRVPEWLAEGWTCRIGKRKR